MEKLSLGRITCLLACFCFLLFLPLTAKSQSVSRQVVGVAGESKDVNNVNLSYTIGESIVGFTISTNNSVSINSGFQQPNLSIYPTTSDQSFSISLSPNPTPDLITIRLLDPSQKDLCLTLTNPEGQVLVSSLVLVPWENELDLSKYPAGMYFITIKDKHKSLQKAYKVMKY